MLLCIASPVEVRAALRAFGKQIEADYWRPIECGEVDLVMTGIGKSNAAGACARFFDPSRHGVIGCAGIGGALPSLHELPLGTSVVASSCIFADEGVRTPDGFIDCSVMGFPLGSFPGSAVPVCAELLDSIRTLVDTAAPIATVSVCSGTDAQAREVAARTGSPVECMEGAAVALVAHRLGAPMFEVRVISNTTGDRHRQSWDLKHALTRLERVLSGNP